MLSILSALACLVLGLLGGILGHWLGKRPGKSWIIGTLAAFGIMALSIPGFYSRELWFTPPFSWFILGTRKWLWLSTAFPLALCILATRASTVNLGWLLRVLSGAAVFRVGLLPAMAPLMAQESMRALKTTIGRDGVCIQSTGFTCGPAAAVTALRALGIHATESELALHFGTSSITGTPDDVAAIGLRNLYADQGLIVEHRFMRSVEEFREWPAALAVIEYSTFQDHFVAILGVTDTMVTVGDPLMGRIQMPIAEFKEKWRQVGVLLRLEKD